MFKIEVPIPKYDEFGIGSFAFRSFLNHTDHHSVGFVDSFFKTRTEARTEGRMSDIVNLYGEDHPKIQRLLEINRKLRSMPSHISIGLVLGDCSRQISFDFEFDRPGNFINKDELPEDLVKDFENGCSWCSNWRDNEESVTEHQNSIEKLNALVETLATLQDLVREGVKKMENTAMEQFLLDKEFERLHEELEEEAKKKGKKKNKKKKKAWLEKLGFRSTSGDDR